MQPKYNIGDKVRVVNYGSRMWVSKEWDFNFKAYPILVETETYAVIDPTFDEVGQEGIVTEVSITQGIPGYSLKKNGKMAWFFENQLELIK